MNTPYQIQINISQYLIAIGIYIAMLYQIFNTPTDPGSSMSADKLSAYQTLYTCLETVAKLMAPIAPFYADRLYMDLISVTGRDNVVSVHLANFPVADESLINTELEARMQMAQDVTSMVLALRRKVNIKVRQPLQCIMIPVVDEDQKRHIEAVKDLIRYERGNPYL